MFIAKILVPNGAEVAVGEPIMITVEDESYVSQFADYKVEAKPPAAPQEVTKPQETPKEAPKVKEVKEASKPKETPKEAPKPKVAKEVSKPMETPKAVTSATKHPWGLHIQDCVMASIIAAEQQSYISKYGGNAHIPVSSK